MYVINGSIGILLHANKLVGIIISVITLAFSVFQGVIKKILIETRKKKKIHDKIVMLAKNKPDNVEYLVSETIIDLEIIHKEFKMIMNEKKDYDNKKENIINRETKSELSESA